MISVVIGTYNRAAMVRQAIEAALKQLTPTDEIIISDDASTDSTWNALQEVAGDPRVRIFRRENNSGGVANWNFALSQTRGEFIALCSDDDRFLRGHLEQSLAYLQAHPEIGFVHSSFVDSLEKLHSREVIERPLRSTAPLTIHRNQLLPYLIRYYDWPFHPSTIVMRREVWDQVGPFDVNYQLTDTDWFVRAVELFPATMLARHGVLNRRHAGNWSNRLGSARMQREIFQIVERFIERRWQGSLVTRLAWRTVWRVNVRLRLALTLRARLKSGYKDAALTSWSGLCAHTGRTAPASIERAGKWLIERYTKHKALPRQESVSPL